MLHNVSGYDSVASENPMDFPSWNQAM